jgi:UDP-3-O-acyl N-acetylglucosamine deacetylase
VRRLSYRCQRTIAKSAEVLGVGFLTGASIRLRFLPAPPGTGIVFARTDVKTSVPIPARPDQVTGTERRTTLGRAPNQIGLVEHVLAALSGLRIDNCLVQLNGPEPPGLDGSARRFVDILIEAGATPQPARRSIWTVDASCVLSQGGATLAIHPDDDCLKISYMLDYGLQSPIGRQMHTQIITPETFISELADSRTFILESEAAALKSQGLGTRTTAADLLVFGPNGPIDNKLRHANEPARHKVLDILGDMALFGQDLRGHVVAYRSGHPLNVQLARKLAGELTGGCMVYKLAA